MPRNLPWKNGGSSTTLARPKQTFNKSAKSSKRSREEKSDSEGGLQDGNVPDEKSASERVDSSPPPQPPVESYMSEGMDHDDKYRMVEDEFLTVAQKWTVHLHTAEFKKLQKIAKTRNAEVIDSISRPVSDKMPNQTRRRVEGLENSKAKRAVIEKLGRNSNIQDTDSDEEGIYFGEGLHTLMISPGKKAGSLSKIGRTKATTRAAAGFQKPAQTKTPFSHDAAPSPPSFKDTYQGSLPFILTNLSTASEDEDDDLDLPVPAPKLQQIERTRVSTSNTLSNARPVASLASFPTSSMDDRSTTIQSTITTTEESSPRSMSLSSWPTTKPTVNWRLAKAEKEAEKQRQIQETKLEKNRCQRKHDAVRDFW